MSAPQAIAGFGLSQGRHPNTMAQAAPSLKVALTSHQTSGLQGHDSQDETIFRGMPKRAAPGNTASTASDAGTLHLVA
jgi:hypothetical protein